MWVKDFYYDGNEYINKTVWEYMCKDNVTFDKAIEVLNLNYKDAVANERDIPNLDIERKSIVTSDLVSNGYINKQQFLRQIRRNCCFIMFYI